MARRRSDISGAPWTWLRQVHGARVVTVTEPGEHAGTEADAIVTAVAGAPIAILTADCAPLLLTAPGAVGVVHAGWRGLMAGVVEAAIDAMVGLGHPPERVVLGPTIRARCYEFDAPDITPVMKRYGSAVRAETGWGTPALDLVAGVRAAVESRHLPLEDGGTCTACSPSHWSYRARSDSARQALVAWISPAVTGPIPPNR
ncbi:MAG: polyphenol oxidase family protein [Aquihabitans sp.]